MKWCWIIQFVILLVIGCVAGAVHHRYAPQRERIDQLLTEFSAGRVDGAGTGQPAARTSGAQRQEEQGGDETSADPDIAVLPLEQDGPLDMTDWPLEITVEQAYEAYVQENLDITFMDARNLEDYVAGHMSKALHVTPEKFFDGSLPEFLNYLSPDYPVIVYCTGGDCDSSHMVKIRLEEICGLTNVHIMVDGFDAWVEAGHPVTEGAEP